MKFLGFLGGLLRKKPPKRGSGQRPEVFSPSHRAAGEAGRHAALVQIVELALKKLSHSLYQALGVYLPLITTNCAVLGVALLNSRQGYNLIESVVNGFSAAIGFTLAIVIFANIRERLARSNMPKWMEGFPGALIIAGLMSLAFQGFSGLL